MESNSEEIVLIWPCLLYVTSNLNILYMKTTLLHTCIIAWIRRNYRPKKYFRGHNENINACREHELHIMQQIFDSSIQNFFPVAELWNLIRELLASSNTCCRQDG